MVERSPEKAGVGGSTPSLATIIPKNLAEFYRPELEKITRVVDHPRMRGRRHKRRVTQSTERGHFAPQHGMQSLLRKA